MQQKIPCLCDNTFTVEIPEEIDLDGEPKYIDEITSGSFMNFTCPSCGKKHRPEFPLVLTWPSHNLRLDVIPELNRGEFYRRKKNPPPVKNLEVVIGYPELSDRIAVIRDGLEPAAVEALKYFLFLKADENYPDSDINIWYQGKRPGSSAEGPISPPGTIEFHLHGIREGEAAITRIPMDVYEKTLADFRRHPRGEVFSALRVRNYLSVQNTIRPAELQ
ncbi:hypothetical protein AGMMS50268_19920 [Spirochaetia bacterium]|nr:hypothetical protein AGMMS50268_19920 [Spirochaetia bacterium]